MGREATAGASKPRIYRDLCRSIDVVPLARAGLFRPGIHLVAAAESRGSLGVPVLEQPISILFRAEIGETDGIWRVGETGQAIPCVREETRAGPRWQFVCAACGRQTRRLLLPEVAPWWAPYACRRCWRVAYRPDREAAIAAARTDLQATEELLQDVLNLRRVQALDWSDLRAVGRRPRPFP